MLFKFLYTLLILFVCIIIYLKIKDNEHSLGFIIVTGIIATIVGNLLIPSGISIFDIFEQTNGTYDESKADKPEIHFDSEDGKKDAESDEEENTEDYISSELVEEPVSFEEQQPESEKETFNGEINIAPIESLSKSINDIADSLLEIGPIDIIYYEGDITDDEQIDTYQFVPTTNGRYRFEIIEMLSGVNINMVVLNQASEEVGSTSYGIENGQGLTIDDMAANETYTIQIKQYSSYSSYKMLIGCQKNTVNIDAGITQIADSVQYKEQRNIYQFTPPINGRYRFELAEMISGSKVDMNIYNPGGELLDGTSYGIANGEGLTINNMNAGETYDIYITQYTSNTAYKLLLGYQKETVQINGETEVLDSVQYTDQINQYQFIPSTNGRYRFEMSNLTSGVKIDINILNQAGGRVDGTSYGIENGEGLTIDNMVAGEYYTIQIIQCNSFSSYKLNIGYQKETVELNANSVCDTIQYTQQENVYQFKPKSNGNYSFTIDRMISGMRMNISIYNEGGECIERTSYGIDNGDGLLIENMVKDEIYTIYVTQYEGEGSYLLMIN